MLSEANACGVALESVFPSPAGHPLQQPISSMDGRLQGCSADEVISRPYVPPVVSAPGAKLPPFWTVVVEK